MSGEPIIGHILLSVFVNAAGLCCAVLDRSMPPRIMLWVCVASMMAILVPWSSVGAYVDVVIAVDTVAGLESLLLAQEFGASDFQEYSIGYIAVLVWFLVGGFWLFCTFARSYYLMRKWRSVASSGMPIARYASESFTREVRRTRFYRLPDTNLVCATGLWRPEIWIGEKLNDEAQLEAAVNHELCHISSHDQLTLWLIAALERMLWWNPLTWMLGREARRQMEYACDQKCRKLIGSDRYRQALAEILLNTRTSVPHFGVPLGRQSDIIKRMEKLQMNHPLKLKHVFILCAGGLLVSVTGASTVAKESANASTLIECHDLLPEGAQYVFEIRSDVDTREGKEHDITMTLLDSTKPGSTEIPQGSEGFVQCVLDVVGIPQDERNLPRS